MPTYPLTALRQWLQSQWVYGATLAGVFVLCLLPAFAMVWPLPLILIYVQLPMYIGHQMEEHYGDRFREFVNQTMAGGRNALSLDAVLVINAGVWVVDFVALYLALYVDTGLGLIAAYLAVVNAVTHIGGAVSMRSYNPGLWTSILLFLPVGIWTLVEVGRAAENPLLDHILGLVTAFVIHIAIVIHVKIRAAQLATTAPSVDVGKQREI